MNEKALYQVAREFGMHLTDPYWPEDLNCWQFNTGQMNEDSTWIHHAFYLAENVEDCLARKLAAREAVKA